MEIHSNLNAKCVLLFSSDIPYGFWFVGSLDQDQSGSRQANGRDPPNTNLLNDIRKMVTQSQVFHTLFINFQKRSEDTSGFPAISEGLFSLPALDKKIVESEGFDQIIPFPRLG
jgi:hypothetical protein